MLRGVKAHDVAWVLGRPPIGGSAALTTRLRDESDAAQMRAAADAERIDTSDLTVDDVVGRIEELVRARQPA